MQACNIPVPSADTGSTGSLTDSSNSSKSIETLPEVRPTNVSSLWDPNTCPRIICHVPQSVGKEISLWDPNDVAEFVRAAKMIALDSKSNGHRSLSESDVESVSGPPPSSVGTNVSAPIQKTCFQSMSEYCSRWCFK